MEIEPSAARWGPWRLNANGTICSDFLLGTADDLRQGALRYTTDDETFLSPPGEGVPRLIALPRLLDLTDALVTHQAADRDLRDLVAAGGSLGGARPKAAVVLDDGILAIAKLPRRGSDEWDVMGCGHYRDPVTRTGPRP